MTVPQPSSPSSTPPILHEISLVIPTLGRAILRRSLQAIEAGSAWPARLIVVDQSSNPEVAAWLRDLAGRGLPTEYVPSAERGRAAGVNRGIERVRTRYLAITDDDCFVDRDWLITMLDCLREHPDSVITGRVDAEEGMIAVATVSSMETVVFTQPRVTFWRFCGGNMGAPAGVVDRAGFMDEDPCLSVAEDNEWSHRLLRAGIPVVYSPRPVVVHAAWRDLSDRSRQYRAYARSEGGFYGKYLRRGDAVIAGRAAFQFLRSVRNWAWGTVMGDRDRAAHGRAFTLGLLPGIIAGWRSQHPRPIRRRPDYPST